MKQMKLSITAMAATGGVLWGAGMFAMGMLNLRNPSYADTFLRMMASVYPGYHARRQRSDVLVGALYGALDGAVSAAVTAAVYNAFVCDRR